MNNKIEITVPAGKKAVQTTDSNGNIIIRFEVEEVKDLRWYVKIFYEHSMYLPIEHIMSHLYDKPYKAIGILDLIARDLNGDWEALPNEMYYSVCWHVKKGRYVVYECLYNWGDFHTMFRSQKAAQKAIDICGKEFLDIIFKRFE
jgi:hypothetical protein